MTKCILFRYVRPLFHFKRGNGVKKAEKAKIWIGNFQVTTLWQITCTQSPNNLHTIFKLPAHNLQQTICNLIWKISLKFIFVPSFRCLNELVCCRHGTKIDDLNRNFQNHETVPNGGTSMVA